MFGRKKRKGLIGNQGQMQNSMNSPLGGLLEGMQAGTGDFAPTPAKSGGTNWGGILKNIAGHVGDAVSQHYGGSAIYGPQQARQEAFEFRAQQQAETLRRQALLQAQRSQDARSLAEYKAGLPTAMQREAAEFNAMTPEDQQERLRYLDLTKPITTNTQFGTTPVFRSQIAGMSQPTQGGYAEGTIIENDNGEQMILRNGQWAPYGGGN